MDKFRNIIFVLLFPMFVLSQQMPHYSLYMINDVIVNPSFISAKQNNQVSLMVRDQWTGFEGAPKTQSISYYNVDHHKFGRGISIVNDVTGPISMLSGTLSGSYLIPIEDRNKLSLGASANILQYKIDNSYIILEDDGIIDPAMNDGVIDKVVGHSASLGLNYFSEKFNLGFSIINLINSDLNLSNTGVSNSLVNHYYFNARYNFSNLKDIVISPSVMLKKVGATNIQLDLNMNTSFNDILWLGVSYRTNDAFVAMMGLNFANYALAYSYDVTTTMMNIPSYGSHGFVLSYKLESREKDFDKDGVYDKDDECRKIPGLINLDGCPDKDKDGIRDSDDDCPEIYGNIENRGCPDKDSDGVIDKDDRCPDVPGLRELNGCPDSDGDGLQDQLDRCPYVKGTLRNLGCPDTIKIINQDTVTVIVNLPSYTDTIEEVTWDNISVFADRVHFDFNKHNLDENSKLILDKIADFLILNTEKNLQINGHADERGTEKYNMKLSLRRAEVVYKYLVKKGVNKQRLSTKSFGESQKTTGSHDQNRRVEFQVLD